MEAGATGDEGEEEEEEEEGEVSQAYSDPPSDPITHTPRAPSGLNPDNTAYQDDSFEDFSDDGDTQVWHIPVQLSW